MTSIGSRQASCRTSPALRSEDNNNQTELKMAKEIMLFGICTAGPHKTTEIYENNLNGICALLSRYGDLKKKEGAVEELDWVADKVLYMLRLGRLTGEGAQDKVREHAFKLEQEIKQIKKEMEG